MQGVAGRKQAAVVDKLRIMFGSCNKVGKEPPLEQPFWPLIEERKPDAWIWAGDNVYVDQRRKLGLGNFLQEVLRSLKSGMHMLDLYFVPSDEARVG